MPETINLTPRLHRLDLECAELRAKYINAKALAYSHVHGLEQTDRHLRDLQDLLREQAIHAPPRARERILARVREIRRHRRQMRARRAELNRA
ncbi:MAG: hypothetical protein IT364_11710 [Candidatus Hydrogenedentes bacterium]|nr:hypothetical protein [Candidatus Hydrogenedentota bacterium]